MQPRAAGAGVEQMRGAMARTNERQEQKKVSFSTNLPQYIRIDNHLSHRLTSLSGCRSSRQMASTLAILPSPQRLQEGSIGEHGHLAELPGAGLQAHPELALQALLLCERAGLCVPLSSNVMTNDGGHVSCGMPSEAAEKPFMRSASTASGSCGFTRGPFQLPVRRLATTTRCGCRGGIDQKLECSVHRIRVGKDPREFWLDQHEVRTGTGLLVVLAANTALELGEVVLGPHVVID